MLLGDACTVVSSLVDPREVPFADMPLVAPDLIGSGGGMIAQPLTAREAGVISGKCLFQSGDVLYSKIRPALNKVALVDFEGVCSADMYALRAHDGVLDARYLLHRLRSPEFVSYATSRSGRLSIPKINRASLTAYPLSDLPPLEEQRRIAGILDQADSLRAKRREILAEVDTLVRSIFLDMFGDFSSVEHRTMSQVVTELQGGRSLVSADPAAVTRRRVLKISAVTSGRFRPGESKPVPDSHLPDRSHFVRAGDLLISRANTTDLVGAVAYVWSTAADLLLPDKLWRFVWTDPDAMDPLFMWALLRTPALRRELSSRSSGTGGSMKNISKAKLMQMPLPWPDPRQQRRFGSAVRAVHAIEQQLLDGVFGADELLASLQDRAFSGRL
jgi:type I restriction enzyme S subunit